MDSQDYIEVTIVFTPFSEETAEIIEAELAELPYDSFVIETDCLKAYVPKESYDSRTLKIVLSGVVPDATFSANLMPPSNWNAQWETEGFTPIVRSGVVVKAYGDESAPRGRYNIKINPQMAFGTGHHQTTRMMIGSMIASRDHIRGNVVMDMGCGTGVLGILAVKMGAAHAYGIDIDAVAARSAYDNARLNRVGRHFETYCGDASLLQMGKYDVLLANIHRNVILLDLRTYARSLRPGGLLFLSGFYESDVPAIEAEATANGLVREAMSSEDGWACLRFSKKSSR